MLKRNPVTSKLLPQTKKRINCFYIPLILCSLTLGCGDKKGKGKPPQFVSGSKTTLKSSALAATFNGSGKNLVMFGPTAQFVKAPGLDATEDSLALKCMEMTSCFTPSNIRGKLLAAGLGISAKGQLETYLFGGDKYSDLSPNSGSPEYDFNFLAPVETTGTLICCNGESSFESEGYFQTAKFLTTQLDVTILFAAPNNTKLNGSYTYRFVLADNTKLGYKRGDILIEDTTDSTYKWAKSDGTLLPTRPDAPAVQDTAVVNWTNPFGKGNLSIPTLEAEFSEGDKVTVTKNDLEKNNLAFSFDLNAKNIVVINMENSMLNSLNTQYDLMSKLHLRGLPHSKMRLPAAFTSKLTLTKTPK